MQEGQKAKRIVIWGWYYGQLVVAGLLLLWALLPAGWANIETPCWTANHPGEGYQELIAAATEIVVRERPEWYKEDVRIGVDLRRERLGYLGVTTNTPKGTLVIHLGQSTLEFCRADDVAQVLFHEFVHVSLWEALENTVPDPVCRSLRHELLANAFVIAARDDIDYDVRLLLLAVQLYRRTYVRAEASCPAVVWADLPAPVFLPGE